MKAEHSSFNGDIPQYYDKYLGPFLFEPYALELVTRVITDNVKNTLEIACGTGRLTRHLRGILPENVILTAIDLNPDMLRLAQEKFVGENIRFMQADAQALPFEDNSFDLIACQFGFMFVPDKGKAFREAFRVLKYGGCLLFNTWDRIENNPVVNCINHVVRDFIKTNSSEFYDVPFSMYDEKEIRRLLTEAGFGNVSLEKVNIEGVGSSAADIVKGFIIGNPVHGEITKIDPEAPSRLIEMAEKEVARLYGKAPVKSKLSAWICQAWK